MNTIDIAVICKALGDSNRLQIVQMLSDGENVVVNYWKPLKLRNQHYRIT